MVVVVKGFSGVDDVVVVVMDDDWVPVTDDGGGVNTGKRGKFGGKFDVVVVVVDWGKLNWDGGLNAAIFGKLKVDDKPFDSNGLVLVVLVSDDWNDGGGVNGENVCCCFTFDNNDDCVAPDTTPGVSKLIGDCDDVDDVGWVAIYMNSLNVVVAL